MIPGQPQAADILFRHASDHLTPFLHSLAFAGTKEDIHVS